jgi:hypothetical protein
MATPNPLLRSQVNNKARNNLVNYYSLNKKNTNAMAFLNSLIKSGKTRMGMGNFHVALNKYKKNKAKANATPRVNPLARPNANRRRPNTPRRVGRFVPDGVMALGKVVRALSGFR